MKVKDAARLIEEFAPPNLSFEYVKNYGGYDNIGLLVGNGETQISKVLLCLDVTNGAVSFARENGYNMIVSHHPFIYAPLTAVTQENSSVLMEVIKSGISVYSAHLNLDITSGGVNDCLLKLLGAEVVGSMFPVLNTGLGRIGKIKPITLSELTMRTRTVLDDKTVWASGNQDEVISSIACIAGGGGGDTENIIMACKLSADVFISSEFKHHVILLAKEMGLNLISASHYGEERIVLPILKELLAKNEIEVGIYTGEDLYI